MKSDISRDTFDPAKHFSRVIMQQGRVQLDADWNEQADILLHYVRALAEDLIGPHGGPADLIDSQGNTIRCGFKIERKVDTGNTVTDLTIGPGRYYVNGLLCEAGEGVTYFKQPFYPLVTQGEKADKLPTPPPYLVYIDVWERGVSSLDYPGIREVALDGTDTAMRTQVVWQIKTELLDASVNRTCSNINDLWSEGKLPGPFELGPRGMLKARVRPQSTESDPCITSPESRYRGAENQLYRVEVHRGGLIGDNPTFKWSRDNGSVVSAWLSMDGNELTAAPVRDSTRGFASGQWVELIHDKQELRASPGRLVQLTQVRGDVLTVDPPPATKPIKWSEEFTNPKVRRWDQQQTDEIKLSRGAIPIVEAAGEDGWITLEDGIQIQFQTGTASQYRTGDYWLIPARTATGDIEWPSQTNNGPSAQGPHGIQHFYAPLAAISAGDAVDLRYQFDPIGECPST